MSSLSSQRTNEISASGPPLGREIVRIYVPGVGSLSWRSAPP